MITTLPIIPANFRKLRVGDEILFRFATEYNGSLILSSDCSKKVKRLDLTLLNFAFISMDDDKYSLHEACFIPKGNVDYPFASEVEQDINKYPSYIYRYAKNHYAFLFATLETKDAGGYKAAREFIDRLEIKKEIGVLP
jgi:hypothetical protein